MKVYSDTLSTADLYEALPRGVKIAVLEVQPRPRKRRNGWIVGLSGSSPYASQLSRTKAATWDEHGLWMAELYRRDPEAVISNYRNAEDFIRQTREWREHVRSNGNGYYTETSQGRRHAEMHRAPWLTEAGEFVR